MSGKKFTNDYKKEMVRLVTDLGKKPAEVAEDIGVSATSVRRWVRQYSIHGEDAFPARASCGRRMPSKKPWRKKIKT